MDIKVNSPWKVLYKDDSVDDKLTVAQMKNKVERFYITYEVALLDRKQVYQLRVKDNETIRTLFVNPLKNLEAVLEDLSSQTSPAVVNEEVLKD